MLGRVTVFGLGEAGSLIATDLVAAGITVHGFDPAGVVTPDGVTRTESPVTKVSMDAGAWHTENPGLAYWYGYALVAPEEDQAQCRDLHYESIDNSEYRVLRPAQDGDRHENRQAQVLHANLECNGPDLDFGQREPARKKITGRHAGYVQACGQHAGGHDVFRNRIECSKRRAHDDDDEQQKRYSAQ